MKNKYNAKKTTINGIEFASKREGKRYHYLWMREKAGEIGRLSVQPKYTFFVNGIKINSYTADFKYFETNNQGVWIVEDVKSPPTATKRDFRRNLKMMKALFNIDVKVVY